MSINTKLFLARIFEFISITGGFMLVAWQTTVLAAVGMTALALGIVLAHIRIAEEAQNG